jgi:hypothetical protein
MPLLFGLVVDWRGYQPGWVLLVVLIVLAALQLRLGRRPAPTSHS